METLHTVTSKIVSVGPDLVEHTCSCGFKSHTHFVWGANKERFSLGGDMDSHLYQNNPKPVEEPEIEGQLWEVVCVGYYGSSISKGFASKSAAQNYADNGIESTSYHVQKQTEEEGVFTPSR
jgi:hypothetical protein